MLPEVQTSKEIKQTGPKIRLIIVDDNFVMRAGLKSALALEADFEVVGEGQNGLEAVRLAAQLQPDLIVMDFRMPLLDGVRATERIIAAQTDAKIVITTWSEEPQTLVEAILAGAKGYLVHGHFTLPELTAAVRSVYEGGALITPSLAPVLLELVKTKVAEQPALKTALNLPEATATTSPEAPETAGSILTRREREILELVQQGKSNRDIAETLVIEEKTVKNHINSLYSKLHLRSRQEAMIYKRS